MTTTYVLTISPEGEETIVHSVCRDVEFIKLIAEATHASSPLAESFAWPGWTDDGKGFFSAEIDNETWRIVPVPDVSRV